MDQERVFTCINRFEMTEEKHNTNISTVLRRSFRAVGWATGKKKQPCRNSPASVMQGKAFLHVHSNPKHTHSSDQSEDHL